MSMIVTMAKANMAMSDTMPIDGTTVNIVIHWDGATVDMEISGFCRWVGWSSFQKLLGLIFQKQGTPLLLTKQEVFDG